MFGTLLGAGIADLGTEAANLTDGSGAAAHEGDADATCFRAVGTNTRTIGSLAHALAGAVIAFLSATTTRGDAGLMLFVSHEKPPGGRILDGTSSLRCKDDAVFVFAVWQAAPAHELLVS
jgi:hypothetical protein